MNFNPTPYEIVPALGHWLTVVGACLAIVLAVSLLTSFAVNGFRGPAAVFGQIAGGLVDLLKISPRRVWALTVLTFREAVRRKALLVFVVFAILFMFAGWFLADANSRADLQVKVYVSFVLTAVSWLVLPVVLLLACWGLPEDIKARSLHTVVTKPARRSEIVIGRILGFTAVGTLVMGIMGTIGYVWTVREVRNGIAGQFEAVVDGEQFKWRREKNRRVTVDYPETIYRADGEAELQEKYPRVYEAYQILLQGRASGEERYETIQDEKWFLKDINGETWGLREADENESEIAIWHAARRIAEEYGGHLHKQAPRLAELYEQAFEDHFARILACRVPVFGDLGFLDRGGNPSEKGVNTGDLNEFRSFIEGATSARAIWEFPASAVTPGEPLVLESRFQSFRTHKGAMGKGLLAQYFFVNPATGLSVPFRAFEVREFREGENVHAIGEMRKIREGEVDHVVGPELPYHDDETKTSRKVDIAKELVHDGKFRIEVACIDAGQYLGMARPDLFIRMPDRNFASGYFKALAGNWMMMTLVVVLGVTASCFVKGPVATLLTFTLLIVGQGFREFMDSLVGKYVAGQLEGGGPFESWYRLLTHMNPKIPIEDETVKMIVELFDGLIFKALWLVQHIIPDFNHFRMAPYVANGFDVDWNAAMLPSIVVTLAYLIPCLLIGYYTLKLRELESK